MKTRITASIAALWLALACLHAQTPEHLSEDDLYVYYFDQQYPDLAKLPENVLPRAQKLTIARNLGRIGRHVTDVKEKFPRQTAYSPADIKKVPPIAPDKKSPLPTIAGLPLGGLRIRDSYQASDLGADLDDREKSKPAIFSFANNLLDDTQVWTAQGSVLLPITLEQPMPGFEALRLIPSVSFNRVSGGPVDKQVNSLIFRGGADFETAGTRLYRDTRYDGMDDVFLIFSLRPNFAYATDFYFESATFAGEFDIEPVVTDWGFGAYTTLFGEKGWMQYRLRLFGHFEGGGVANAGNIASLQDKDPILRVGFYSQVELRLNPFLYPKSFFNNLTASARYELYPSMTDAPTISLFTAGLGYALGDYLSLEFQYQKGRLALTAEEIDLFTIGLGIEL